MDTASLKTTQDLWSNTEPWESVLHYAQHFQHNPNFSLQPLIQVLNQPKYVFSSSSPAASQTPC